MGVALSVVIMLGVINVIGFYFNNSLIVNQQNSTTEDLNSTLYAITNDIRHASRASTTEHLQILNNGRTLVLYRNGPGNYMTRITYRLEDNGDLVRETAQSTNEIYPYVFPTNNQSRTVILSNVRDAVIFEDKSSSGTELEMRLIEVRIAIRDFNNRYSEEASMRVMSRVREGGV